MMDISNIFQSLVIMALYSFVVLFVPSTVLGKRLSNRRLCERFMIYVVFGNFYIINVVYILQLMHISNVFMVVMLYSCPIVYAKIRPHWREFCGWMQSVMQVFDRLLRGTIGPRTYAGIVKVKAKAFLAARRQSLSVIRNRKNLEAFAIVALMALICYMYGSNSVVNYGYLASDLSVHNYWINAMIDNQIFVAGVYPHGYHCVIYFMHEVFGIQVSILLRLFAMTSAVYVHMVLWAFIRYLTKSRYAAYGAVVLYVAVNFLNSGCYSRFADNLPQEYGIIFIFPTFYFLFEYMKHERTHGKKNIEYKVRKRFDLAGAACSFSLTIAVHFYGTMIVGLFCVAFIFAYWMRFFRPAFFLRLMAALLAGIVMAALPMAASIAQGNHFQGSIGWGLEIISGTSSKSFSSSSTNSSSGTTNTTDSSGTDTGADSSQNGSQQVSGTTEVKKVPLSERINSRIEKIIYKCRAMYIGFNTALKYNVVLDNSQIWEKVINACMVVVFVYGTISAILDWKKYDSDYGCQYVTIALGMFVMIVALLLAGYVHLPYIMDSNRSRIYFMYSMTVLVGIVLDIVPGIMSRLIHKRVWIYNSVSLIMAVAVVVSLTAVYGIRPYVCNSRLMRMQTNGAVYCMYKIMAEHSDDNWTIVSPVDEYRMLGKRGFHYELSDFMKELKNSTKFTLPTKEVYIFIEKQPLDYTISSKYSGQYVSEEGAKLNYTANYKGNNMYKGEIRYALMCKMYYWALKYQEVYPEDFTVYYEDDEFICYKLVQNTSFLNNLIVDYGYN